MVAAETNPSTLNASIQASVDNVSNPPVSVENVIHPYRIPPANLLPCFGGEDHESIEAWLADLIPTFNLYAFPSSQWHLIAHLVLKDTAKTWYAQETERRRKESSEPYTYQAFKSWSEFIEALKKYFKKASPKFTALMKLFKLKCGDISTFGKYVDDFNKLVVASGVMESEDIAIGFFIHGLPEPFYTIAFNEVNINGTSELMKIRRLVEQHALVHVSPPTPANLNNVVIEQRVSKPKSNPKRNKKHKKCDNCGRNNHDTKDCWGLTKSKNLKGKGQ